jgi:hypothetical protein
MVIEITPNKTRQPLSWSPTINTFTAFYSDLGLKEMPIVITLRRVDNGATCDYIYHKADKDMDGDVVSYSYISLGGRKESYIILWNT